jgi:hypothetical protein
MQIGFTAYTPTASMQDQPPQKLTWKKRLLPVQTRGVCVG